MRDSVNRLLGLPTLIIASVAAQPDWALPLVAALVPVPVVSKVQRPELSAELPAELSAELPAQPQACPSGSHLFSR